MEISAYRHASWWARIVRCHALFLLSLLFAIVAQAQSPAPLPNPNLNLVINGNVLAIVRLPDGSVVFGGTFSSVNGTPRSKIAKLQADGTFDPNWNPSADSDVYALATDAAGNVYAGGVFGSIGAQSRSHIAKLSGSGTGAADASWNPSADNQVNALAIDAAGNVYAGGYFTSIGTQSRSHIAKLSGSGTGAADAIWNPSANSPVYALATDAAGDVYAGGSFTSIGTQSRSYIAKLSGSGTGAADATWNPSANSTVYALAIDATGNVYAGGIFSSIGTQSRNNIAKLSGSGSGAADASWDPSANSQVQGLAIDAAGNVYACGFFTSIGSQSRNYIAKLAGSGTGAADASWDPSANGVVNALATDATGNIYAGGNFNSIGGQSRLGFAVLSSTATAGNAIDAELPGSVSAIAGQASGGMIVGGAFLKAGGLARANILRLQTDGTLDTAWNPSANGQVNVLATDAVGDVYAGGSFTSIGGQSRNTIAKLSGSGTGIADASWDPSPIGGGVLALAIDVAGDVYAGGSFFIIGTQSRNYIAKLSGSGTGAADATWNPSASSPVYALATDAAGDVYAGGSFFNIGTQSRNYIAKLSGGGTGAADATWDPSANNQVHALVTDSAGNVYAGGSFTNIGTQNRIFIAKLSGSGTGAADATWDPSANNVVTALATDTDGNVYVGGSFTSIGAQNRNYIAKLSDSGTGAADANWNPSANTAVAALATDATGNIYAGGNFSNIGGQLRLALAALPATVPTSTTLASSLNPSDAGQSVMFTATVTGSTPGGSVDFKDGAMTLSTQTLSGGSATFSTTALTAGSHSITAVYSGDANNLGSTSNTVTQQVNPALAVSIGAQSNVTCNGGSNGSLTATASNGTTPYAYSWSPTGGTNATASGLVAGTYTVTVTDNASASAQTSATVTQPAPITFNPATLPNGTVQSVYSQSITASGGNAGGYGFTLTSGALPTGLSLAGNGLLSGTPTAAGPYTFTATATDPRSCAGAQSYTVTIAQAAQTLTFGSTPTVVVNGTGTVSATSASPNSGNAITFSTSSTDCSVTSAGIVTGTNAGTNNCAIVATQASDANYSVGTATQTFSIGKADQVITFPAQSPASYSFVPNGTFAINPLATSAIPNSGNAIAYSSLTGSVCSVSGTTVTMISAGPCTLAADQASSSNYNNAAQATQNVAVNKVVTTTTLSTNCMTTFVENQKFMMTAGVTGSNVTGSVTFSQDATTLCNNVALSAGSASCTANSLAVMGTDAEDSYSLTASYSGDADNAVSASTSLAVTVLNASDVVYRNGFEMDALSCPIE